MFSKGSIYNVWSLKSSVINFCGSSCQIKAITESTAINFILERRFYAPIKIFEHLNVDLRNWRLNYSS